MCVYVHVSSSQVGDKVDARDLRMGAWFEAEVVKVTSEPTAGSSSSDEATIFYHVKFDE